VDWELLARILVAALPLASAIAGATRRSDPLRRQMSADAQVLQALPAGSEAHTSLLVVLGKAARTLQERQSYSRNYPALVFAIIGSLGFGYLAIWLGQQGAWWTWGLATICAVIWVVFFVGIFDSAQLRDQAQHKADRERRKAAKGAIPSVHRTGPRPG
jgi:hypothetical protein